MVEWPNNVEGYHSHETNASPMRGHYEIHCQKAPQMYFWGWLGYNCVQIIQSSGFKDNCWDISTLR